MRAEEIAIQEFEKVGDDKLFPNHTDKDIWISGFKTGYEHSKTNLIEALKEIISAIDGEEEMTPYHPAYKAAKTAINKAHGL